MASTKQLGSSIWTCLRCSNRIHNGRSVQLASFSSSSRRCEEVQTQETSKLPDPSQFSYDVSKLDPDTVANRKEERRLKESKGLSPIGSRRRRAVLKYHKDTNLPFEQLPFQCFQEALKVLNTNREEKLKAINKTKTRLAMLKASDPRESGGEWMKGNRIRSLEQHLEKLIIEADIRMPLIKKRHEDSKGDMDKPIYRYLADRDWRQYRRKVVMQRIEQMGVVPDLLQSIDPVADVTMSFKDRPVKPGEKVPSIISSVPLSLNVQVFDKGERLVTVVVVDGDVPLLDKDSFDYRCHYIACNIPISPKSGSITPKQLKADNKVAIHWLPPHSQKGAPYHRMCVFVLEQAEGQTLDINAVKESEERDGFVIRSFIDRHKLTPVGVNMFRTEWDEYTAGVMKRAGIPGAEVEYKFKRIERLPYKKKKSDRFR